MYTAEMKNPVRDSLASKKAKVVLVMEQLALTSCKSVKIGNALDRGISGVPDLSHLIWKPHILTAHPRVLLVQPYRSHCYHPCMMCPQDFWTLPATACLKPVLLG